MICSSRILQNEEIMMKKLSTAIVLSIIVAATLFATGCPERTSIADIEANPSKYQNKEVAIAGTVTCPDSRSAPRTTVVAGSLEQSNASAIDLMAKLTEVTRSFETLQRGVSMLSNDLDARAISELARR